MKKFREFVAEAAKAPEGDHHKEAVKIIKKHAAAEVEHSEGDHPEDTRHLHLTVAHPKKIEKLHAALETAGFKKHAKKDHPPMGVASGGGGDGAVYHKFSKGKTHVYVSHKPNDSIEAGGHTGDHHRVEAETEHGGK